MWRPCKYALLLPLLVLDTQHPIVTNPSASLWKPLFRHTSLLSPIVPAAASPLLTTRGGGNGRYFAMGHCRNGARCRFSHNGAEGYSQSYHHQTVPFQPSRQEQHRSGSAGPMQQPYRDQQLLGQKPHRDHGYRANARGASCMSICISIYMATVPMLELPHQPNCI